MKNILVVEDSSYQRGVIRKAVHGEGRNVTEAANADEALAAIKANSPDIILSDILMPGMSGIEMLAKLRESGSKIPVIVISADIQEPTRKECMDLGAVGFIFKPLVGESLATLKNLLNEYLG
jgi:twitching motility two-component system response regulator PilH